MHETAPLLLVQASWNLPVLSFFVCSAVLLMFYSLSPIKPFCPQTEIYICMRFVPRPSDSTEKIQGNLLTIFQQRAPSQTLVERNMRAAERSLCGLRTPLFATLFLFFPNAVQACLLRTPSPPALPPESLNSMRFRPQTIEQQQRYVRSKQTKTGTVRSNGL